MVTMHPRPLSLNRLIVDWLLIDWNWLIAFLFFPQMTYFIQI